MGYLLILRFSYLKGEPVPYFPGGMKWMNPFIVIKTNPLL
jgi:hypothetical protein